MVNIKNNESYIHSRATSVSQHMAPRSENRLSRAGLHKVRGSAPLEHRAWDVGPVLSRRAWLIRDIYGGRASMTLVTIDSDQSRRGEGLFEDDT